MKLLLNLVVVLTVLCVCSAQDVTDCNVLRVGTTGAPFVLQGGSTVCPNLADTPQCCTADFLEGTITTARDSFRTALGKELERNRESYEEFVRDIDAFFNGQFVQGLAESFDISQFILGDVLSQVQGFITSSLIPNLNITPSSTPFNIDEFVSNLFSRLSQSFSISLPGVSLSLDAGTITCIGDIFGRNIDSSIQTLIDNSIQIVRQSYSILLRIQQFLLTLQNPDFTPVQGCLERLAQFSYCGRCTQRIPPLCRGTCNNLVRGCLSPLYTAYRNDFQRLWIYVQNILTNLKMRISELFSEDRNLLPNVASLFDTIQSECSINIPFTGKRSPQSSDDSSDGETSALDTAFNGLFEDVRDLDGFFEYDSDGPEFCEPESDEMSYCNSDNRDPSSLRSCAVGDICVSQCDCWDGTEMSTSDTATVSVGSSVEDQATNPAVDGLMTELQAQAVTLEQSSPARAFLESNEIAELNPMGVVIPGNGAVRMIISITVMTLAVIVGLVF